MITLKMFTNGFYILGFDLTPDREADEEHLFLPLKGNLRIAALFYKRLPENVTCDLYTDFPGHVDIENARKVTIE